MAPNARIGRGTVVFAGAVVQPGTDIGQHAILNTGCSVDHDCEIGDFVHVAPGSRVAGTAKIEEGALLGLACGVIQVSHSRRLGDSRCRRDRDLEHPRPHDRNRRPGPVSRSACTAASLTGPVRHTYPHGPLKAWLDRYREHALRGLLRAVPPGHRSERHTVGLAREGIGHSRSARRRPSDSAGGDGSPALHT